MVNYDAVIIGAGPAGLAAAMACGSDTVTVIEKNSMAGQKLLASGSGQCNFTHTGDRESFLHHYGAQGRFLRFALAGFDNKTFVRFLEERHVPVITDKLGKYFPESLSARSIRDALADEARKGGISFYYNTSVTGLSRLGEEGFVIQSTGEEVSARFVVISTGGKSYPATGSTGDGYTLAQGLGHNLVPPKPALSPFYIKSFSYAGCTGISFKGARLTLWRNGKKVAQGSGDLLITHQGLSGPVVLDISRYAEAGDICKVAFLTPEESEKLSAAFLSGGGKKSLKGLLGSHTPLAAAFLERFLEFCLEEFGLDREKPAAHVSREERKRILTLLTEHPFEIEEVGGFKKAMVTAGGIPLDEVNPKTMESRLVKGLFFAGEILDIDGDSGGYNIQAAVSTGYAAGSEIRRRITQSLKID